MKLSPFQSHLYPLSFGLLFLLCGSAFAQQTPQISLTVTGQEEQYAIDNDGTTVTVYSDLSSVVPGDIVLYTISYHNLGEMPADTVVINNPIPAQMNYQDGSADSSSSAIIKFSVDGGKTFASPSQLTVTKADDTSRPAMASDYTHVQWQLLDTVPSQQQGTVTYKAKLK